MHCTAVTLFCLVMTSLFPLATTPWPQYKLIRTLQRYHIPPRIINVSPWNNIEACNCKSKVMALLPLKKILLGVSCRRLRLRCHKSLEFEGLSSFFVVCVPPNMNQGGPWDMANKTQSVTSLDSLKEQAFPNSLLNIGLQKQQQHLKEKWQILFKNVAESLHNHCYDDPLHIFFKRGEVGRRELSRMKHDNRIAFQNHKHITHKILCTRYGGQVT